MFVLPVKAFQWKKKKILSVFKSLTTKPDDSHNLAYFTVKFSVTKKALHSYKSHCIGFFIEVVSSAVQTEAKNYTKKSGKC